jgi:aminoglycoside phosphotransferase (APT) family kinase protein
VTEATEQLSAAIRRRFGGAARIENVEIPTLGGSNRTIVFDLVEGASSRRLVSREETYRAPTSPFLPPSIQFRLLQRVFARGFPVPEPLFEYGEQDDMSPGYICAFMEGETLPKAILHAPHLAAVRPLIAAQCGRLLGMLHALPREEFAFLAETADSIDPLEAQRARFDSYGGGRPAVELGLRWLERNRPPCAEPVLLHGDFRIGNVMVTPTGISAVLDWECAHLGARLEDLGWLCMRAWRFDRPDQIVGGLDTTEALFAAYERESGFQVDADLVHYWMVFGLVRWAIINLMQVSGHVSGARRGLVFAACGRNVSLIEYDLLMTLDGRYK